MFAFRISPVVHAHLRSSSRFVSPARNNTQLYFSRKSKCNKISIMYNDDDWYNCESMKHFNDFFVCLLIEYSLRLLAYR